MQNKSREERRECQSDCDAEGLPSVEAKVTDAGIGAGGSAR